jgi:hypothetical protein
MVRGPPFISATAGVVVAVLSVGIIAPQNTRAAIIQRYLQIPTGKTPRCKSVQIT